MLNLPEDVENRRAHGGIRQVKPHVFGEVHVIGVRILAAGFRADVVNHALVVGEEERAGRRIHHCVSVFVHGQVLGFKFGGLHPKILGDSGCIRLGNDGWNASAAASTFQAVDFLENGIVYLIGELIQRLPTSAFQALHDFPVLGSGAFLPAFPVFDEVVWHEAKIGGLAEQQLNRLNPLNFLILLDKIPRMQSTF